MTQIILTADETPITRFEVLSDPPGQNDGSGTLPSSVSLTERAGSQNTSLSAGEIVDVTLLPDTPTESAEYLGFLTVDGADYPVFRQTESGWLVAGIALDPADFPDIDTVLPLLNTTDPFTDFASVCFAEGTAIATPDGPRAVETLQIGDLVSCAEGGAARVRWIGRQTLRPWLGGPQKARLVQISAGALGNGLPLRDLFVTPDHAVMLEGCLINAGALVDGAGIAWRPIRETCTVYHVETDDHDIILAEGAAVETFVDYVGRQSFDNYDEYVALYGTRTAIPENPAPRITSARMVPQAVRARLGLNQAA